MDDFDSMWEPFPYDPDNETECFQESDLYVALKQEEEERKYLRALAALWKDILAYFPPRLVDKDPIFLCNFEDYSEVTDDGLITWCSREDPRVSFSSIEDVASLVECSNFLNYMKEKQVQKRAEDLHANAHKPLFTIDSIGLKICENEILWFYPCYDINKAEVCNRSFSYVYEAMRAIKAAYVPPEPSDPDMLPF